MTTLKEIDERINSLERLRKMTDDYEQGMKILTDINLLKEWRADKVATIEAIKLHKDVWWASTDYFADGLKDTELGTFVDKVITAFCEGLLKQLGGEDKT